MKYDMTHALPLLYPGVRWSLNGESYSGLEWYSDTPQPSAAELEEKIKELQDAEPMRLLRVERDRRLADTDQITLKAYRQGIPVPEEWTIYQQALADLPATAEPQLNEYYELDMDSVNWPIKPVNT
jgi:hypothetical protein